VARCRGEGYGSAQSRLSRSYAPPVSSPFRAIPAPPASSDCPRAGERQIEKERETTLDAACSRDNRLGCHATRRILYASRVRSFRVPAGFNTSRPRQVCGRSTLDVLTLEGKRPDAAAGVKREEPSRKSHFPLAKRDWRTLAFFYLVCIRL